MKNKLINNIPNLIIPFLYLQPFLDMIAAFFMKKNISINITALIRMLFMGIMIIYIFFHKYENKKKYVTLTLITLLIISIHAGIMYYIKPNFIITELRYTLSTYYFIFVALSFMVIYKEKQFDRKHLRNILFIYLFFTFVPTISGLSFESYDFSKTGKLGWFYSANAVGTIIVILLSISMTNLRKLNLIWKILLTVIILYVSVTIGTKTPVLGLAIIMGLNLLYLLIKIIKEKKIKLLMIIGTGVIVILIGSFIIIPKTNFYENIQRHLTYLEENNYKVPSLKFIDHFIFSRRFTKEEKIRKYYNNSSVIEKAFGVGYIEKNKKGIYEYNIAEIDYFDLFYKEGIVGFILFMGILIYMVINYIKNLKFDFDGVNKFACILLILLISFFQGHILLTPAMSIFVALILASNMKRGVKNEVHN